MTRHAKRHNSLWQSLLEALFPGCLFCRLDLKLKDVSPVRSTSGVVGLVRIGGNLTPVPEGLVAQLQSCHEGDATDFGALFKRGDEVTLIDVRFKGLSGIFQTGSSLERVAILLDLVGQECRFDIYLHQIAQR